MLDIKKLHNKIEGIISKDPEILNGTPVFIGTRVPIKNLFDYLENGETIGKFLENFPSVDKQKVNYITKCVQK